MISTFSPMSILTKSTIRMCINSKREENMARKWAVFCHTLFCQNTKILTQATVKLKGKKTFGAPSGRESCQLRPWAWSHSTLIRGSSPLFLYFRMMPEWRDGARMTGMETWMTSGRPPHSVVPGPVQSFQGHPCHSSGMRTHLTLRSFHLGMIPKWEVSHSKVIPAGNELGMKDFQTTIFLSLNE